MTQDTHFLNFLNLITTKKKEKMTSPMNCHCPNLLAGHLSQCSYAKKKLHQDSHLEYFKKLVKQEGVLYTPTEAQIQEWPSHQLRLEMKRCQPRWGFCKRNSGHRGPHSQTPDVEIEIKINNQGNKSMTDDELEAIELEARCGLKAAKDAVFKLISEIRNLREQEFFAEAYDLRNAVDDRRNCLAGIAVLQAALMTIRDTCQGEATVIAAEALQKYLGIGQEAETDE